MKLRTITILLGVFSQTPTLWAAQATGRAQVRIVSPHQRIRVSLPEVSAEKNSPAPGTRDEHAASIVLPAAASALTTLTLIYE